MLTKDYITILGDHKYSHFSEIKPQKLHPEILDKFKIRQPTARYLAMHLHAREVSLGSTFSVCQLMQLKEL